MKFCIKDIFAFVSISYNWQTKGVITRALFLKSPNNYRVGKAAVVAFKMEVSTFFYIT